MSERKLRKQLEVLLGRFQYDYECLSLLPNPSIEVIPEVKAARKALADPPDVVEVLRRATKGSEEAINDFEKFMYDCEIRWIEQTFHVRLTETGWEYTDE